MIDSVNTAQFCCLHYPAERSQTALMKSFAELLQTALRCGSSSCSKTPCSSWQAIQSDSCMLTAAPPIKTGDLSEPCACPVGELWPCKYASDTFAVPIIESQPICRVMHMILKAQRCVFGCYSSLNHQGSQQQHMSHDFCYVTTANGKQPHLHY